MLGREVGVRMRQSFILMLVTKITVLSSPQPPPPPNFYGSLAIHGGVDIGDSSLSYTLRMGLLSIRDQCRGRVKVILH